MRSESCGSVQIVWLNREQAIQELKERARDLLARDARVRAVGLFGSLARDDALPSSDADVLLVLESHPEPRWFDRIPEYAAAFDGTSLPVEPFPYTLNELRRLAAAPGFLSTALKEILHLGGDEAIWPQLLSAPKP
ncbi:MAG: nucleotidyltransferase domain-containing protein [Thermoflexales bacterium]|nr:nucleotidyltransferase domain-containing protein [Thermoflexales bacterium]